MAQQNATINGTLIFQGTFAGQASIQAQPIGGNLIFQLPNQLPTVNQLVAVESVSGNVVTFGFANPQSLNNIPLTALSTSGATSGDVIQFNGTNWAVSASVPGSGTVTTFSAGTLAPLFTTSVATATSTPALSFILTNAAQNAVFAGPAVGGSGAPSYRALVIADIPSGLPYLASSTVLPATFSAVTHEFLTSYTSSTGLFTAAQPAFTDLSGSLAVAQINSKQGNGNAVQLTNTGATVAGDVVTYDANSNVVDSGTLLSSLATNTALALKANLASPSFTGGIGVTGDITTTSGSLFIHGNNNGESIMQIFTGTAGSPASTEVIAIDVNGNLQLISAGLRDSANSLGTNGQVLTSTGSAILWASVSASFTGLTGGTNTTAALVVGSGASLTFTGSGTINASSLGGNSAASYALLAGATFTGTLETTGNLLVAGALEDGNSQPGTAGQVLSSTGGSVSWHSLLTNSAGAPPASSVDNHIASGTFTINGTTPVPIGLTLGGQFSAGNTYVIHLSYNSTPSGAQTGVLYVVSTTQTATGFSVASTDATDTASVIAWTAVGF